MSGAAGERSRIRSGTPRVGRAGAASLLLAALVAAPALAQAQDEAGGLPGASRPGDGLPGTEGGAGGLFRGVPTGPDGAPLDYRPPAPPQPETVRADRAVLVFLDKMTGQVRRIEMRPGETRVEDRLELALETCRVPAQDARGDASAYLRIRDTREEAPRFAGWMFASSPALSALDHARYDVWVESCSASSGVQSSDSE